MPKSDMTIHFRIYFSDGKKRDVFSDAPFLLAILDAVDSSEYTRDEVYKIENL